jgi:hypothetical protein
MINKMESRIGHERRDSNSEISPWLARDDYLFSVARLGNWFRTNHLKLVLLSSEASLTFFFLITCKAEFAVAEKYDKLPTY